MILTDLRSMLDKLLTINQEPHEMILTAALQFGG
jgi:hypothetical protein